MTISSPLRPALKSAVQSAIGDGGDVDPGVWSPFVITTGYNEEEEFAGYGANYLAVGSIDVEPYSKSTLVMFGQYDDPSTLYIYFTGDITEQLAQFFYVKIGGYTEEIGDFSINYSSGLDLTTMTKSFAPDYFKNTPTVNVEFQY